MNNTSNKLLPDLRFPEFVNDGEWKKDSLGDLGQFLGGGTPDRSESDYWIGDIPWISSSDIKDDDIHNISITRFINDNAVKQSATKIVPKGSILFVSRVGVGKLAINQYYLCTSQDFTNFIPTKVLNYFVGYYFSANKHLLKSLNQGTSIKGFTKSDLENLKLFHPENLREQQKIASCLSSLDEVIAAHSQKLEALKEHKKGLMQNLFPQEGEMVPKYRFPEFLGDGVWEEKNLEEVSEIGRGKSKHRPRDASFLYGGSFPFIQTGDIRKAGLYLTEYSQTYSDEGLKQSKLWEENTLCITIAANIAETAILKMKACFPDSIIGIVPKKKIASVIFIKFMFDKYKSQLQSLSQGVAQDNLNQEKLSKIKFAFPLFTEQQKIADCFFSLEELIMAEIEKVEKLKLYKKGLMQGLFPNVVD